MTDNVQRDQYGRRTWDVEAYARETHKRRKVDDEIPNTSHVLSDNSSTSLLSHRRKLIASLLKAVKTFNIIDPNSGNSLYGKDKRFGFFCPVCNLSFRDNLSLIDHFNSPQHTSKASNSTSEGGDGEYFEAGVKKATVEQVKSMIESLVMKLIRERTSEQTKIPFAERVQKRHEFEERMREKRREKKRTVKKEHSDTEHDKELIETMGFSGFGLTK